MSTRPRLQPNKAAVNKPKARQHGNVDTGTRREGRDVPSLLAALSSISQTTEDAVTTVKKVLTSMLPGDARKLSMKLVNATSSAMAEAQQSGWAAAKPVKGYTRRGIKNCVQVLLFSLDILRREVAVPATERAALNVVGRLTAMAMYEDALSLLLGIREGISQLYQPTDLPPKHSTDDAVKPITLPLPSNSLETEQEVVIIASTYQLYALQVALRASQEGVFPVPDDSRYHEYGVIISWLQLVLPEKTKQVQPLATSLLKATETKGQLMGYQTWTKMRLFALRCVLVLSSAVEVPWVWKQARNIASAYIKTSALETAEEIQPLHEGLAACIDTIKTQRDLVRLLEDPSFDNVRQLWYKAATKCSHIRALNYLEGLCPQLTNVRIERPERSALKSIATFEARIESCINDEDFNKKQHIFSGACEYLKGIHSTVSGKIDAPEAVATFKVVERLRRKLRRHQSSPMAKALSSYLVCLFSEMANIYTACLTSCGNSDEASMDILCAAVENWIVLSKSRLSPLDTKTYKQAYQELDNAKKLTDGFHECRSDVVETRIADLWRCLSGAFWNAGSAIYQAGKWDHAVPFISSGVEIDERLVEPSFIRNRLPDETWNTFYQQMPKRVQLLAGCSAKLGNYQRSYELYINSLRCALAILSDELREHCLEVPSTKAFEPSQFQDIATIVDRLTFLGTKELLLGSRVSLHSFLLLLELDPVVVGALLERQLRSFESSIWKPETWTAAIDIVQSVDTLYADRHPIRQARLALTYLEFRYFARSGWTESKRIVDSALKNVSETDLGLDGPLVGYRYQIRISLHIWAAFHAHFHALDPAFHYHMESARVSLRPNDVQVSASPKGFVPTKKPGIPTLKSTRSRGNKGQTTRVPTRRMQAKGTSTSSSAVSFSLELDDEEKFWMLLEMAWSLCGAIGLTKLKIDWLCICTNILRERASSFEKNVFSLATIELASECSNIGKISLSTAIFSEALHTINNSSTNDQTKLLFLLRFALSLADGGDTDKSLELYAEAHELAKGINWNEGASSSFDRSQSRISHYFLTALACFTYAKIQMEKEAPASAYQAYMQALRVSNAALESLQKFKSDSAINMERNPFDMDGLLSTLPAGTDDAPCGHSDSALDRLHAPVPRGWHWKLGRILLEVQLATARYHVYKGNPRGAEYFLGQARTVAGILHGPTVVCEVHCLEANLFMHWGRVDDAIESLRFAEEHSRSLPASVVAEVMVQKSHYYIRIGDLDRATSALASAEESLKLYNDSVQEVLQNMSWSASSNSGQVQEETALPGLIVSVLLKQIWLQRNEDYSHLVDQLDETATTPTLKSYSSFLIAKLSSHLARIYLGSQPLLSSLFDSVVALPWGMQHLSERSRMASLREILQALNSSKEECGSALELLRARGMPSQFRECIMMQVFSDILQASVGNAASSSCHTSFLSLNAAASVTFSREMAECIGARMHDLRHINDTSWPTSNTAASTLSMKSQHRTIDLFSKLDGNDQKDAIKDKIQAYWSALEEKYHPNSLTAGLKVEHLNQLPTTWTIVALCLSEDKDHLFISRFRPQSEPALLCIPLQRASRIESQSTNGFTFDDATKEMQDIVHLSSRNGKRAAEIVDQGKEVRSEWWSERRALDDRLQTLLENMEYCWLGAFKAILAPISEFGPTARESVHSRVYSVFKKIVHKGEKKKSPLSRLNDTTIEIVASLSSKCRDEELEDVIYFILDLYQLSGYSVFLDDIDIDEVIIELRSVLSEIEKIKGNKNKPKQDNEHIFLVLDKNLQGFPLESLPILRGRPISRIPSITTLIDWLSLAKARNQQQNEPHSRQELADRVEVDPTKVYYVLNPEGDLKRTEQTFTPWLQSMRKVGWNGIIGRRPTEFELSRALSNNDLFIYFGHGGAEQYIRGSKIRSLTCCSCAMLWGCSSGAMPYAGDFDRSGTPYSYLLGGCPLLVANLWDVTDRDIDKLAQAVFHKLRMDPINVQATSQGKQDHRVSVVQAVAESRDVCKLKYLNGAAPVVYGIPFYL